MIAEAKKEHQLGAKYMKARGETSPPFNPSSVDTSAIEEGKSYYRSFSFAAKPNTDHLINLLEKVLVPKRLF
jgi:hypothetical protein